MPKEAMDSRIAPKNPPVTYSHLLVSGFRSSRQMVRPPSGRLGNRWRCALNTDRKGAVPAAERQNWDLVGKVSQSVVLWHMHLRTAPAVRKRNAKHLSLEPSFGSHKCKAFFFTLLIYTGCKTVQNEKNMLLCFVGSFTKDR